MRLYEEFTHTIEIEKSRFICILSRVFSEAEAREKIQSIRKAMPDATHHCTAFVIGENNELARSNDDGEPSGTAGAPMLNIISSKKITNILVVVTRYFGGTLLGTGGLVRAYSGATKAGLEASLVITKKHGQKLTIDTDYTGLGKIQYILGQRGLTILNSIYTDKVALEVLLPEDDIKPVMDEIREGTNGQAVMELKEECYFASVEGNIEIFEN